MKTRVLEAMLLGLLMAGCGPVEQDATVATADDQTTTSDAELRRRANACMWIKCAAGSHCETTPTGGGQCVVDDPCLMVKCWAGTHCEAAPGGGSSCVPNVDPCATVRCIQGTHCDSSSGTAACVADINGCMTVKCASGYHCESDPYGHAGCYANP